MTELQFCAVRGGKSEAVITDFFEHPKVFRHKGIKCYLRGGLIYEKMKERIVGMPASI